MANVIRAVKLPDGTTTNVKVPEGWGAAEIRKALVDKGVIKDQATPADTSATTDTSPNPAPDATPVPSPGTDQAPAAPRYADQTAQNDRTWNDLPAFKDVAPTQQPAVPEPSLREKAIGAGEAALTATTGLTSGLVGTAAGFATQLAKEIASGNFGSADSVDRVANAAGDFGASLTYSPRTAAGRESAQALNDAVSPYLPAVAGLGAEFNAVLQAARSSIPVIASAGRMADWSVQRAKQIDKPVAPTEVVDALIKHDVPVPKAAEVQKLTETLDELRIQQHVHEKVQQLQPKSGDPVEVARYKRRELQKLGVTDQPPIEVVRARVRDRQRQIDTIEAKVRETENKKALAQPAVAKADEVGANAKVQADTALNHAEAAPDVRMDTSVPRRTRGDQVGRLKVIDSLGNAVIDRIQKISPSLAIAVRRVTQRAATRANATIGKMMKFYDSPERGQLSKGDRLALDRHLLNGDNVAAEAIMEKVPGLVDLYKEHVQKPLYAMQKARVEAGADGFIEYFHPRVVKNVNALRRAARRQGTVGKLDQALADAERLSQKQNGHGLDERQVTSLINQHLGGRALKVLRERRINEITPEMQRYYETSRNSLLDYVRKYHTDEATREFFKNSLGKEVDFGKNSVNEVTVGELLAKSLGETGGVNANALSELGDLLATHFGVSRQGPGAFQRGFKNLFTAGTLGSPMSTLTQLGDVAPVMSKFGILNALRSANPFRVKTGDVTVYDIGVRELSRDLRSVHGTAKVVRAALEYTGFDKLDTMMANNGVRAALMKWQRLATASPEKVRAHFERFFTPQESVQLIKDLQAKTMTDDVKTWLLHELGDIRPVSREDMPLEWNRNPNGRWKYSLLSWTMKQMNHARNRALHEWRTGRKLTAVGNLTKFAVLMGLTNGSVQMVKDFIAGRPIDPTSDLVTGMLAIGMSGKYALEALRANKGLSALGSILPALGITADAIQHVFTGVVNGDYMKILEATPAGRNIMNMLLGPVIPATVGQVAKMVQSGAQQQPAVTAPEKPVEATSAKVVPVASQPEKSPPGSYREAKRLLTEREGNKAEVYQNRIPDGHGGTKLDVPTGGIGHALTATEQKQYPVGSTVPRDVRDRWFLKDSAKAYASAQKQAKEIGRPDMVAVLTSVNFQLGTGWTGDFKMTWKLMKAGKWQEAADEVARSAWYRQTPTRVKDLQSALVAKR